MSQVLREALGRCGTCEFCTFREAFTHGNKQTMPICAKYRLALTGAETTNCAGWVAAAPDALRATGGE